jgi:hypothetical protein
MESRTFTLIGGVFTGTLFGILETEEQSSIKFIFGYIYVSDTALYSPFMGFLLCIIPGHNATFMMNDPQTLLGNQVFFFFNSLLGNQVFFFFNSYTVNDPFDAVILVINTL